MSSPIRLLVAGLRWPPEPFIRQLLAGLRTSGIHLTVAATTAPDPDEADGFARVAASSGLSLRAVAALGRRDPARLPTMIATTVTRSPQARPSVTLAAIRAARPDVIYLPWTATGVDLPVLFDLEVPVIVSCRGSQVNIAPWSPDRAALKEGLPGLFARAAAVHCVSTAIREEARHHGLDPGKATVIRPAVDLGRFPVVPPRQSGGPLELITIGTVSWRKATEDALLAVRRLVDEGMDVAYTIIGPEADGGAARHAVRDLGLDGRVRLAGPVPWDQIGAHIAGADLLVHSSLSEGIPNVVLEAMATGRPVVATDVGGMNEAVTDGVEGALVPTSDPAALAAAIAGLADPERRARLGRAGRARIEADFALARQVAAFGDLVERAAGGVR